MFLFGLAKGPSGLDPLLLLMAALLIDVAIGPFLTARKLSFHPLNLFAAFVAVLDRKLNRARRSTLDRAMRGAFLVFALAIAGGGTGWIVAWLARVIPHGFLIELIAIVLLVDQRAVHDQVRRVGQALAGQGQGNGLGAARDELGALSGSDDTRMDAHAVARTAIELTARSFAYGVVAPTFWYVLFGLPGLFLVRAVTVIDDMIGDPSDHHRAFGFTANRLDEVMVLVPAPLAGVFMLLASFFVPTARPTRAMRAMLGRDGPYSSRSMGWPVGAMAGALGIALAGPRRAAPGAPRTPWVDAGTARASPLDIRRALFIFAVACLINGASVAALAVAHLV